MKGEPAYPRQPAASGATDRLIKRSAAMRELSRMLETIGPSNATVLIEGETGVGKTLVARILHEIGPRCHRPFVAFDTGNLSPELFESQLFGHLKGALAGAHEDRPGLAREADGGTLFLDEVGELSPGNQAMLLTFLDRREVRPVGGVETTRVDLRIISATNRNLKVEVEKGGFRRDLFYRLRVLPLRVPSLRERRDDVPLLARYFVDQQCRKYGKRIAGISPEAMARLSAHVWEGNVRELENEMERAVILTPEGQEIGAESLLLGKDLPSAETPKRAPTLRAVRAVAERELIQQALERLHWNVTAVAQELGISREGLSRKLKRLGITRPRLKRTG